MFVQPRRNVRMGVGRDVGIHAQSHAGNLAQSCGALGERPEFRFAFHIEQQNPGLQCRGHLVARLSHSGEDDHLRSAAVGGPHPLQFSAGNYVKTASLPRQQSQDAQVGICFHRVADGVGNIAKRFLKRRQALADRGRRINVEWSSVALCQFG